MAFDNLNEKRESERNEQKKALFGPREMKFVKFF